VDWILFELFYNDREKLGASCKGQEGLAKGKNRVCILQGSLVLKIKRKNKVK